MQCFTNAGIEALHSGHLLTVTTGAAGFTFLDRVIAHRAFSRKLECEADTMGLEVNDSAQEPEHARR